MNTRKIYQALEYFQEEANRFEILKDDADEIQSYIIGTMTPSGDVFDFDGKSIKILGKVIESLLFVDNEASRPVTRPLHLSGELKKRIQPATLTLLNTKWESLEFMKKKITNSCNRSLSDPIKKHKDSTSSFNIDQSILVASDRYGDFLYLENAHNALKIVIAALDEEEDNHKKCGELLDQIESLFGKMEKTTASKPLVISEIITGLASDVKRTIADGDYLARFQLPLMIKGESGVEEAERVTKCGEEARKIIGYNSMSFGALLGGYKDYLDMIVKAITNPSHGALRNKTKWSLIIAFIYVLIDMWLLSESDIEAYTGRYTQILDSVPMINESLVNVTSVQYNDYLYRCRRNPVLSCSYHAKLESGSGGRFFLQRVIGLLVGSFGFMSILEIFVDLSIDQTHDEEYTSKINKFFTGFYALIHLAPVALLVITDSIAVKNWSFYQGYLWFTLLLLLLPFVVWGFDRIVKRLEPRLNQIISGRLNK